MRSQQKGHHFAGSGNYFWRLLADSGLTPRLLTYYEDGELLAYQLGLVNLVTRATPGSADLDRQELSQGAPMLRQALVQYQPKIVAFLGKDVFRGYRQLRYTKPCDWGVQPDSHRAGIWEVVLPNPSRRSTIPYSLRLHYFCLLKALVDDGPHPRP